MDIDKVATEIYAADPSTRVAEVTTYTTDSRGQTIQTRYQINFYPGSYEKLFRWSVHTLPLRLPEKQEDVKC